MKNKSNVPLVHLIGIIALVAVIGFSMTACGDDDDNGNNGGGWKAVTNTTFGTGPDNSGAINAIAWGGAAGQEKFVAVGGRSIGAAGEGKMAYSSDGVTWTAVADSKFGTSMINAITYGNNKFVAGDSDGKMATSLDGITWTAVADSKFNGSINAITWGKDKFVAGGDVGKIAYSSDGITWTAVDVSGIFGGFNLTHSINGIAYSDDYWGPGTAKFVAVGGGGKMAYSSDGVTWTAVADSKFGGSISAIAWGFLRFVAGGSGGKVAESTDGDRNWIDRLGEEGMDSKFGGQSINAITHGNNKFVAVGEGGKAAYLPDPDRETGAGGNYWTAIANTTFNISIGNGLFNPGRIYGIAYGNGKFVAVGYTYESSNTNGEIVGYTKPHIAYWIDN